MATYDLLVVGGGVQGLWLARAGVAAGLRVALAEAETCGAGASGGPLGALMPHIPTGWSDKKQLQFDALIELERLARELTDETGLDTGYTRCGRLMPVRTKGFLAQFEARRTASRQRWHTPAARFELELLPANACPSWFRPEAAEFGLIRDPLAARIDPVRYIQALRRSVNGRCDIYEGWPFAAWDAATGRATSTTAGADIIAGKVVLAAGYQTFGLAHALTGLDLGSGVKGQAVLLEASLPPERPLIYDDGMYIVAHSPTHCAIGSTTEASWSDPRTTDDALDAKIAHARHLCPPLGDAPVVASWAGVRPKSAARDPIVGRLLPDAALYIASGGFKITLGIAHTVAGRLIDAIVRDRAPTGLPETFSPSVHIAAARDRRGDASKIA